jgi:hypothetical protein
MILFGLSIIETDQSFLESEDFWIIVAARNDEDETEIRAGKAAGRRDQGHSARDTSAC